MPPAQRTGPLSRRANDRQSRRQKALTRRTLNEVQRAEMEESAGDVMDKTWLPLRRVKRRVKLRDTRLSTDRRFFKAANEVTVLEPSHHLGDEAAQHGEFLEKVRGMEVTTSPAHLNPNVKYCETQHGIWISSVLRYKNLKQKTAAIRKHPNEPYWSQICATVDTIGKTMKVLLTQPQSRKPICVIVGGRVMRKQDGHSVLLAIVPSINGHKAFIKDSVSIKEANLKILARFLLKILKIKNVEVVGNFDWEANVVNTDCLKECLKEAGSVLDGRGFWNRHLDGFFKTYNVNAWKRIY